MARLSAVSRGTATSRGFRTTGGTGGGGEPPEDPAPTITSGPTLVTRTTTSITLTWTADQFVQSWVEYGTTTGYGTESAHETSFNYQTHVQTISGLTPGTTYHFKVHVVNQAAQETTGSDTTFATEDADEEPSSFYDGVTTTDVYWPTGPGWTTGSESTILANIQALIDSSGNGNGPQGGGVTHFVCHRLSAGAVYPINNGIDLSLRSYLIFEGGGTEYRAQEQVTVGGVTRWRILDTGHQGGATIRTSGSPSASPSGRGSAFYSQRASALAAATNIRMHCLTIEGSSTNYATTSAGNGGERQHGIHGAGWDDVWIDHCIFDKNKGDGIYLTDSYGGNQNGFRSRNWRITNTRLRRNGRMLVAVVHGTGVTIEDCLFEDACYAHIDIEPNHSWATCGDLRVARCTFGDWGWDPDFYGSPLLMTAAEDGVQFTGYIEWIDNVHVGLSKTTGRPAEWNSDVTMAPYSVYTKTGPLTMTGNIRVTSSKPGPAIYLSRNQGGSTVTNNKGFLTSGSFVGGSAGGSVTQSGNT